MPSTTSTIRNVGMATREMFEALKYGRDPSDVPLPSSDEHLRSELKRIADRVLSASLVHYVLDWDSNTYYDVTRTQDGGSAVKEAEFREQFRPLDAGDIIRDSCIVIDQKRTVEAVYLADAIEPERLAKITHLAQNVRPCLERNGPKPGDENSSEAWRQKKGYFHSKDTIFAAGLFTASPGWQMQGHEAKKWPVKPSRDFATLGHKPSRLQTLLQAWVTEMRDCALILSAALAATHPEQFELSLKSLDELCKTEPFASLAEQWAFAFTAVSVISNRATPEHRDKSSGGYGIFDLLLSVGGCARTVLELRGLGLEFAYPSGTLVLFSGNVHLHTVSKSQQERMCIACYARKAMYHKFGTRLPSAVTVEGLLSRDYEYL